MRTAKAQSHLPMSQWDNGSREASERKEERSKELPIQSAVVGEHNEGYEDPFRRQGLVNNEEEWG